MEPEIEPMQQPIRKIVGRTTTTPLERLRRLENLIAFLKKHAPASLVQREGDYYPVRKTVGRPRR